MTAATSRSAGSARRGLPREGGGQVAEQPRPAQAAAADDDAVAPVSATMRSASSASQMSPLPSTGMSTASTSRAIGAQSAVPQ